jgi:hypothetical protein
MNINSVTIFGRIEKFQKKDSEDNYLVELVKDDTGKACCISISSQILQKHNITLMQDDYLSGIGYVDTKSIIQIYKIFPETFSFVELIGNVGQITKEGTNKKGQTFSYFSIATNIPKKSDDQKKDKQKEYEPVWFNILTYLPTNELRKGETIFVKGYLDIENIGNGADEKWVNSVLAFSIRKLSYKKKTQSRFAKKKDN